MVRISRFIIRVYFDLELAKMMGKKKKNQINL